MQVKSHTGFQLVLTSVTLNDLERRNDRRGALSLRYLTQILRFILGLTFALGLDLG